MHEAKNRERQKLKKKKNNLRFVLFCFVVFPKTGFHCIVLTTLELRDPSASVFLGAGIKGMKHHCRLKWRFLK